MSDAFGSDNSWAKRFAQALNETVMPPAPGNDHDPNCACGGESVDLTDILGVNVVATADALVHGEIPNLGLIVGYYKGKTVGIVCNINPMTEGSVVVPIAVIITPELMDDLVVNGAIRVKDGER